MADPSEQRRQRRVVAGVLAGAVALGAVGVGAVVLLTGGPCDDLLPASFTSPPAVADGGEVIAAVAGAEDAPAIAASVVDAGEALDLGPVRGATASAADAVAIPADDGAFVVADDEHVRIVDTGLVAVASGRERPAASEVVRVGDELAIVAPAPDGGRLIARYDPELSLRRCRELPGDGEVVHVSTGVALVARGGDVEAVRLDGAPLWEAAGATASEVVDGDVTGLLAIVASREEVVAYELRSGALAWRIGRAQLGAELTDEPLLLAGDDLVVVATGTSVVQLDGEDGSVIGTDPVDTPATAAVATGTDVAVVAGAELLRVAGDEDARRTRLPAPVAGDADRAVATRAGDVLVVTESGLALARADGEVVAAPVAARTVAVSDGYTIVGVDAGAGVGADLLAFYGPAS